MDHRNTSLLILYHGKLAHSFKQEIVSNMYCAINSINQSSVSGEHVELLSITQSATEIDNMHDVQ